MKRDFKQLAELIIEWADHESKIRRVWAGMHDKSVNIAIELEPIADSDEELLLWMSKAEAWQADLQQQTSRTVHLEWLDPYASNGTVQSPDSTYSLIYDRN